MKLSLQGTLLALTATALLAGIVPAAITLDRLLAGELEAKLRADVLEHPACSRTATERSPKR